MKEHMDTGCKDIFQYYRLPFETYFHRSCEHLNQIHEDLEFIWVLRGDVCIECDSVTYRMAAKNFFVVNAYQLHTIRAENDPVVITFRFRNEYLKRNSISFDGMRFINRIYPLEELVQKYQEIPTLIAQLAGLLIDRGNSSHIRYKIIGYYNILIYELYNMLLKERYLDIKKKNVSLHLKRLNKIINYINQNYRANISLDDLSGQLGISRCRLSHFIKEYLGISFREYLMNMRTEHALSLLRSSRLQVRDIARRSGFSDIKYLNQSIRARFNMTALKYRKMVLEERSGGVDRIRTASAFLEELKSCLYGASIPGAEPEAQESLSP